jgi:hypothetical protein
MFVLAHLEQLTFSVLKPIALKNYANYAWLLASGAQTFQVGIRWDGEVGEGGNIACAPGLKQAPKWRKGK